MKRPGNWRHLSVVMLIGLTGLCTSAQVAASPLDEYRNSWEQQALKLQRNLDLGEPLGRNNIQKTHNSYNSSAYASLGSYHDPNQQYSLVDQLDMGIRALELDVHYTTASSFSKELLLCHGQASHIGCSSFDRPFEDGLKEIATWLRQSANRQEVIILYLQEHVDGQYDRAVEQLNRQMGDLIYKPQGCQTLPMNISRADILNAGKQVLLVGGNCGNANWANTVFNYGYPTGNGSFQPYPACRTGGHDRQFVLNNIVRIFEDSTMLSNIFSNPPPAITPELMAQAMQCSLGVVGLDQVVPFDPRLRAAIWSWNAGEPNNWNGIEHCAEQSANGRFNDLDCGSQRPFACLNEQTREWRVTQGSGNWQVGETTCEAEFGPGFQFSVPKNGYMNQLLVEAKAARGVDSAWLHYTDQGHEGDWRPVGQPQINPPTNGNPVVWRKLRNDQGKCLDLEGRKTADGTEIHQWRCHGADSQLWWQDEYGLIHNKSAPDKCVDVANAGTGKGARITLWSCHGGANQVWLRSVSNSFRISNAPGMALDIKDPLWGDGRRAHLWEFHGGKSQRWSWD